MARKYISKVTFELSATIGEPTTRKLVSARLTIEMSNALDANPIHGRHRPWRSAQRMPQLTRAAASVTLNPATCTGSCEACIRFQVGAISSSAMANARTRATTSSPSIQAAASAASGRDQSGGGQAPAVYEVA